MARNEDGGSDASGGGGCSLAVPRQVGVRGVASELLLLLLEGHLTDHVLLGGQVLLMKMKKCTFFFWASFCLCCLMRSSRRRVSSWEFVILLMVFSGIGRFT